MKAETPSVLLIYASGATGMIENPKADALENFNLDHLLKHVFELKRFSYRISSYQSGPPPDSSDMEPAYWAKLVKTINYNYDHFGDFITLHGTDTMAYTVSVLSFILENLSKSTILTGSQLPIGTLCTDGKENLAAAIEIAAAKDPDDIAIAPEIYVFFKSHLMRGNRATKINTENFNALRFSNYPSLARVGTHIKYEPNLIRKPGPTKPLKPHYLFDTNAAILALFSDAQESIATFLLYVPGLKAVIMKTFGSGNAPQKEWFVHQLREATDRGIIIVNITQCTSGAMKVGHYETGIHLLEAGIISGYDSTPGCAVTELMFLLGHGLPNKGIRYRTNSYLIEGITRS